MTKIFTLEQPIIESLLQAADKTLLPDDCSNTKSNNCYRLTTEAILFVLQNPQNKDQIIEQSSEEHANENRESDE
jgi:hypothetical protein